MEKDKGIKRIDDIDEMLESKSILQYMLDKEGEEKTKEFHETIRTALELSIKSNTSNLDYTKTSFIRKLNKYLYRNISELTDQEIADEVYYIDMIPKQIEIIKSIRSFHEGGYFKLLNLPAEILVLKEKYIQLTDELLNLKQSIHERMMQFFINRIDDVRNKIANGKLIPNYDDEESSKDIDKFNLLYKKMIDEMKL